MQLTCLELYNRVCERPLSKIAPEFGISGTVLASLCKRYQVPYPGSGLWTRKLLGLPVDLPPLPEASDELIELTSPTPKPRRKRTVKEGSVRQPRPAMKPQGPARHPLLFGVAHAKNTRRKRGRVPQYLARSSARISGWYFSTQSILRLGYRGFHSTSPLSCNFQITG